MAASSPKARLMTDIKARLMNPATTSNYEVFFGIDGNEKLIKYIRGAGGLPYTSDDKILIHLSCTDASLPGSSFTTHELTNDFSGITEKHAYRRQYDNQIDLTFMVDRNYKLIRFFESWMGFITDEKESFDPKKSQNSYRVKFPKDYQTNLLHITKFEKDIDRDDQGPKLEYTFINAFPIALSSMPVSYAQTDLLKVNVTMSYSRYYNTLIRPFRSGNSPRPTAPGSPELNVPINPATGKPVERPFNGLLSDEEWYQYYRFGTQYAENPFVVAPSD